MLFQSGKSSLDFFTKRLFKLFEMLNVIVQEMITHPKQIDNFFKVMPKISKEAIIERDKDSTSNPE